MLKAIREAKIYTHWSHPNIAHENAVKEFIAALLSDLSPETNQFLADFLPFQGKIAHYGALNSLAQVVLKIAAPGVPDIYQGTELWDFSLVDPDNRRPVNYEVRTAMLDELKRKEREMTGVNFAGELSGGKDDGRIKMYLTYKALTFRKANHGLFQKGEYLPLAAVGPRADHVCAFARKTADSSMIVAVPRFLWRLLRENGSMSLGEALWDGTYLSLPDSDREVQYRNIFTAETIGVDPRMPLLPADSGEPAVIPVDPKQLTEQALRQRPEISQAQASIDAAVHGISAAKTTGRSSARVRITCSARAIFASIDRPLSISPLRATRSADAPRPRRMSIFDSPMNPLAGMAGFEAVNAIGWRCFSINQITYAATGT